CPTALRCSVLTHREHSAFSAAEPDPPAHTAHLRAVPDRASVLRAHSSGALRIQRGRARPSGAYGAPAGRARPRLGAPCSIALELVEGLGPALLQEARERSVREELAARLALRAVVRLVVRVADALHGRAADGAGL